MNKNINKKINSQLFLLKKEKKQDPAVLKQNKKQIKGIIYLLTEDLKAYKIISYDLEDSFLILRLAIDVLKRKILWACNYPCYEIYGFAGFGLENMEPKFLTKEQAACMPDARIGRTYKKIVKKLGGYKILEI